MKITDKYDDLICNLDSLLVQLRIQVTPKWYQFGVAIGIDKETLDRYSTYPSDECIVEVLDYWLRTHHDVLTWSEVAKVLKQINLSQLADNILKVYETGEMELLK